ncbi:unnamed protein product, partial [Vitis vinifera]
MEEDVSRTKASHRKVKVQALALALAKESGIIIPKLDLYPLLFPLLRGFWVVEFFNFFVFAYKMHFRSSYQNAGIELVFVSIWTARSSSSWLRRKRRELWRRKKLP